MIDIEYFKNRIRNITSRKPEPLRGYVTQIDQEFLDADVVDPIFTSGTQYLILGDWFLIATNRGPGDLYVIKDNEFHEDFTHALNPVLLTDLVPDATPEELDSYTPVLQINGF